MSFYNNFSSIQIDCKNRSKMEVWKTEAREMHHLKFDGRFRPVQIVCFTQRDLSEEVTKRTSKKKILREYPKK